MKDMKMTVLPTGAADFPPNTMSVWVTKNDWAQIFPNGEQPDEPRYVKVVSKHVLAKFTFYAKVSLLSDKMAFADGSIFVPKGVLHGTWMYEKDMDVSVASVDNKNLAVAESVVVSLNPEEVANWSDDEVLTAENLFRSRVGVVYVWQMVNVNPATKQTVRGEVTALFPKPKERGVAYRVGDNTKVIFEGLPAKRQKVIDFSKIGGLDSVINRLREIIQIPINYPELLTRFGIDPPKGMILYGPPGNGKTMIARAVAQSMGSSFIEIEFSEVKSKYFGEGERRLTEKFQEAATKGNCVVFIDEIDSLASMRSDKSGEAQVSLVATLLVLMDGMNSNSRVFVIGATNRLEAVDPALRRPGRFDLEFEVPLPDTDARLDILHKYVPLKHQELLAPDVNEQSMELLSELTGGYSGADMKMLYREAAMGAIRRHMTFDAKSGRVQLNGEMEDIKLQHEDFLTAMKGITPTQMRGEQSIASHTLWDDIVALDDQKAELQRIESVFSQCVNNSELQERPSCANLLVKGRRGTGKRTLSSAFAKRYGYDLLVSDCIELGAMMPDDAMREIRRIVTKCRQSAPAVWVIRNLDRCEYADSVANKIVGELQRLNKHLKVMAILTAENIDRLPESALGYKAFQKIINLDISTDQIVRGMQSLFPNVSISSAEIGNSTLGELIQKQREKNIIDKITL
ncbi:MAG: AAA family ATPase [Bacteroidales bacterium]|nr:AAA family ATPase [Bacteroidales bacterium]